MSSHTGDICEELLCKKIYCEQRKKQDILHYKIFITEKYLKFVYKNNFIIIIFM